jgi:hypothetical protein
VKNRQSESLKKSNLSFVGFGERVVGVDENDDE